MQIKDTLKTPFHRWIYDIRFWILLFFLLRLFGITNPPLEEINNWRQTTGDMVARNFYETDHSIFFPRLDMAGDKTGITGTEFPLLNYLTYLLSLVFGFHDWLGRLINLFISSAGVFYFYKLLKLKLDEKLSFFASYLLLISNWLIFSRKMMPDTFSTSLVIIGMYAGFNYFKNYKWKNLIIYFLLVTAGVLSKIPAVFLLALLILPLLDKHLPFRFKCYFLLVNCVIFVAVYAWYFYWVPYLVNKYEYSYYYMGVNMKFGFQQLLADIPDLLKRFYVDALKFTGFACFVAGVLIVFLRKEKQLISIFLISGLAFFIFMLKAGDSFCLHPYYIIPFVPIMCLFAARFITGIKKQRLGILLLLAITIENSAGQYEDFLINDGERYKLSLERIADQVSKRDDLVAINCGENPQQLYMLHRKGWLLDSKQAVNTVFLSELQNKQCKFLFINKHVDEKMISPPLIRVYDDADISVYSLSR